MALLLITDGNYEITPDPKAGIKEFMDAQRVEWHTISTDEVGENEEPWRSPHLQGKPLEEEIEDDHFRSENWKYYTQFMCNENGRMEKLDRNEWCKKVRGDIFIYKSCVCDWDGSNYICPLSPTETDRVELIRCLKDYVERHPGFCEG